MQDLKKVNRNKRENSRGGEEMFLKDRSSGVGNWQVDPLNGEYE